MNANQRGKEYFPQILLNLIFIVVSMVILLPIVLVVSSSLSNETAIRANGYSIVPRGFTLVAYETIFHNSKQLIQSLSVTTMSTLCGTVLGLCLVASLSYVMSRSDYKYKNLLGFFVFFTMLFRGGMVPSYILISKWLGLKDHFLVLFLPLLVNAFYVLIMKAFFRTVPEALYEAAKIDGASEFYVFTRIAVPLAKPGLATIGLFLSLNFGMTGSKA